MGRDSVSCDQQLEDQQWVVESRRFQRKIDVFSCSNSISSLSFCLEFCLRHQNIIFKAQNKKKYSRYADLSILLFKCERVMANLWINDLFKTERLARFAEGQKSLGRLEQAGARRARSNVRRICASFLFLFLLFLLLGWHHSCLPEDDG